MSGRHLCYREISPVKTVVGSFV